MIDLSNNNVANVNFRRVYAGGTRRVYLKLTEGKAFLDQRHAHFRHAALAAGLLVGEYHFARPSQSSPADEAHWFARNLPPLSAGHALRPVLDLEDPAVQPSYLIATWAREFIERVQHATGHAVVVYGNSWFLGGCHFEGSTGAKPPGALWLASYGRNDGREYQYVVPKPWRAAAAHQYSSEGRVAGVTGPVDISHVFERGALDVA